MRLRSWLRWHRSLWVDPIGWDPKAQRLHDCEPTPYGLLHFSTCWCRLAAPTGEETP